MRNKHLRVNVNRLACFLVRQMTVAVFASVFVCLSGCAVVHNYGSYEGKIVDAGTGEPLEGAAVLAVYYTESYGLAGSNSNYLDAQETVTDVNGEFKIPSNLIFTFRPLQSFEPWAWFIMFKPGYACYGDYPWHKDIKPIFMPSGTLPSEQYVTVRLPKIYTREERIENLMCNPSTGVDKKKYKSLIRLRNVECRILGIQEDVE